MKKLNDQTVVSLGLVIGSLTGFVAVVWWAAGVTSASAANTEEVISVKSEVRTIREDVKVIKSILCFENRERCRALSEK